MTLHWLVPIRHQTAIHRLSQQVSSVFLTAPHNTQVKVHPISKLNSLHLLPFTHVGFIQLHKQTVLLVVASVFKESLNGCSQSAYNFLFLFLFNIHFLWISGRKLAEHHGRGYLELKKVGLSTIIVEVTVSSLPLVVWIEYWMEIQSCLIAVPVHLPWVPASSWWFRVQKGTWEHAPACSIYLLDTDFRGNIVLSCSHMAKALLQELQIP